MRGPDEDERGREREQVLSSELVVCKIIMYLSDVRAGEKQKEENRKRGCVEGESWHERKAKSSRE